MRPMGYNWAKKKNEESFYWFICHHVGRDDFM